MNAPKKRSNAVVTMTETGTYDQPTLTFAVHGEGELVLNLTALSDEVKTRALIHGLKQRISDAAAIACNPETGKPATSREKFDRMEALVTHLNSGTTEWTRKREAGEGTPRAGKILVAMMRVYGFADEEKARAYVEATAIKRGIDYKAALALWKSADKIVAELAKMAAEAPAKLDADDLLADIEP